ncbi:MAG: helix-turn-helix domain-containing protein [Sphingobacterium composti]|uniref:helix-turn-helix domain-containing protein n=1 Tax=Sphingobacterium composti TaxID=363260 RepID=UPI00135AE13C|nr:helix-turn-helix domain-containing protein [Sphingobacterium composti Ten et al. 2007 non Yoo et al. 2007]
MELTQEEISSLRIGLRKDKDKSNLKYSLKRHAGSIVESIIRRKGHNISKLARTMKISRCTLYNWFEHDNLPFDILIRIGSCIDYDFSTDFPEVFNVHTNQKTEPSYLQNQLTENEKVDFWIRKYILLLEKYNDSLMNKTYSSEHI